MMRRGEEPVSCQKAPAVSRESGMAGVPSAVGPAVGPAVGATRALGEGIEGGLQLLRAPLWCEVPRGCPLCALSHESCGGSEPPPLTASREISHCGAVFPKA